MTEAKPSRVINLSYFLGSEHPPHVATKLNVLGMDNRFEAFATPRRQPRGLRQFARRQRDAETFRRRSVTEDDFRHGSNQDAVHKIFNEFQAQDYNEKYGMTITKHSSANVTGRQGPRLSSTMYNWITRLARGKSALFRTRTPCAVRRTSTTSRNFFTWSDDRQTTPQHLQLRGHGDQLGRSRRHRPRFPAGRADQLRTRDRRT